MNECMWTKRLIGTQRPFSAITFFPKSGPLSLFKSNEQGVTPEYNSPGGASSYCTPMSKPNLEFGILFFVTFMPIMANS